MLGWVFRTSPDGTGVRVLLETMKTGKHNGPSKSPGFEAKAAQFGTTEQWLAGAGVSPLALT